jgi:hypothetical protein
MGPGNLPNVVMCALVAGIYVFISALEAKDVDGRNESGQDEGRFNGSETRETVYPGCGAARSGAPLFQDRLKLRSRNDPGSAAHHSASP